MPDITPAAVRAEFARTGVEQKEIARKLGIREDQLSRLINSNFDEERKLLARTFKLLRGLPTK